LVSANYVSIEDLVIRVDTGQVSGASLRNFCLKLSDIVQAIRDIPSSVNRTEYLEALQYAIEGQSE
jgi:hypothetical protein